MAAPNNPGPLRRDTLSFVTYTNAPQDEAREQTNRDIVRSRAMRSGHVARNQKDTPVQQLQESELIRSQDRKQRIGRFRVKLDKKKPLVTQQKGLAVVEPRQIDDEPILHLPAMDPFITSLGSDAWHLFHHCVLRGLLDALQFGANELADRYHFRHGSMAINAKQNGFSFVIADASTAQAFLSLISMDRDLVRGLPASPLTIHHRTAAISKCYSLLIRDDR
jgi:hypothetical protein